MSPAPPLGKFDISGTAKAQTSGWRAQTSTNKAQSNGSLWISKPCGVGADHVTCTPSLKVQYIGNGESTKVGM